MRSLPVIVFSKNKAELVEQIDRVHRELAEFYRELPLDRMLVPADPLGWSARKNLHHIASTNRTMARYIGLPGWVLRMMGRPANASLTVEQIVPTNRPHITDHGTYRTGRTLDAKRLDRDINDLLESARMLAAAIEGKTEEQLDSLKSLFGGMTLRMFAHFVLKHSVYHSYVVRFRMENR